MARNTWVLTALLCAACAPVAEAPPEPVFGEIALVSSAGSEQGATPSYLVTPGGGQITSWVSQLRGDSSLSVLRLMVRKADESSARLRVIRDPLGAIEPHGEAPPQLAASASGQVYALYTVGKDVGQRYPASALRFVRSFDGGTTWEAPLTLNEGETFGAHNFQGLTAGQGKDVYVTWLNNTGKAAVWLRISHDAGKTWEPARAISTGEACPCCRTAVTVAADGTVYLAWRDVGSGNVRDVVVASSKDGGTTWTTPVKPRDHGWVFPGCPHAGPSLKTSRDGAVHIAWWTGKPGEAGIWYARSTDQGRTWNAMPVDTADAATPSHVQLTLDVGGRVVVAWDGGKGAMPQVFVRASGDSGRTFGPRFGVSDPKDAASFPVLAIRGDSLAVAWTQATSEAYRTVLEQQKEPEGAHERMALPQVGQQEVFSRVARLSALYLRPTP